MKYIMFKRTDKEEYLPVVFDESFTHRSASRVRIMDYMQFPYELVSAGFVYRNPTGGFFVGHQSSESLNLGPAEHDQRILNLFLGEGLSGISLTNKLHELLAAVPAAAS